MRILVVIFVMGTSIAYGQSPYSWDYVIKYVRANKMDVTKATREIFAEISDKYKGADQQAEIVRFYRDAYDFKIVDKPLLDRAIDSISVNGLNEVIRSQASAARDVIMNRLLTKKINDFEFLDVHDKPVRLSSVNDKYVVIELWATWCGPCIKEMKKIPGIRKSNPAVEFYSISLDKSPDKMKKFVEKNKYEWPIVFGGDQEGNPSLWDYLHIVAIPKYYVVDKTGVVINVSDHIDEEFISKLR